ncbi:hypothetical protein KDI_40430 [Dictyobacter arantiisoli]|uniref:SAM-dependent chlorinase/fluorinase n=2 Tax=Dictyobacter arantiisoli TaxID=2014874 RepID=A0A5A5THH4_9CHLR|nr:hypothetical protein KDI_40430 [Dictyobacter arantiisoli]
MLGIAPGVSFIDLTHEIAPQNIYAGSLALAESYRYFPAGTVFLCVVDPGVGSARAPIAIHAGNWYFVAPDNGLLHTIIEQQPVHAVVRLSNPNYHLSAVSSTFQGRDIFAPVAAHLAAGVPVQELGEALDVARLQQLDIVQPLVKQDRIEAEIVHVDHFGNLITNISLSLIPDFFTRPGVRLMLPAQQEMITQRRRFFAEQPDDPTPFLLIDSSGAVGIAVCNGSAADFLGVGSGESVTLLWNEA